MTQVGQDTLGTRSTLSVGGRDFAFYSLKKAAARIGDVSRLPFSMKVLLENLLRFEDGGFTVSVGDLSPDPHAGGSCADAAVPPDRSADRTDGRRA